MADLNKLYEAILNGDDAAAIALTKEAIEEKVDPMVLMSGAMIPAMDEVGRRYERQEYFLPELLIAGFAMKGAMELIRPLLAASGVQPAGRVVIGTVMGDAHDIGKNVVGAMLEGGGFEVADLGVDVPPERFIQAVREKNPDIVCLSCLLTVTMPSMKKTIEAIREAGVRERVKILVGGAPVTAEYAKEIDADGYGESASEAVTLARQVCERSSAAQLNSNT